MAKKLDLLTSEIFTKRMNEVADAVGVQLEEKEITITEAGDFTLVPEAGKMWSKVIIHVDIAEEEEGE